MPRRVTVTPPSRKYSRNIVTYNATQQRVRNRRKGQTSKYTTKVYSYIRSAQAPVEAHWKVTIGAGGTAQPNNAETFQLSDCPQYAEFTAIYDMYKINKIEISLRATAISTIDQTNGTTRETPTFFFVKDYDDDTAITTTDGYLQYQNMRLLDTRRSYKITVYPKILNMVYDGISSTAYSQPTKAPWIDLANPEVPHYGIKFGSGDKVFSSTVTGVEFGWQVFYKYYISFKDVR